jgi:hypothetical protein
MKTHMLPLAVLFATVACNGKNNDSSDTAALGEESIVWAGWNHTWNLLSHRVAAERAILTEDAEADLGAIGGDWSTGSGATDYPLFRMRYARARSTGLLVHHGETEVTVGPDGIVAVSEDIEAAGVAALPNHVVVLRGIDIRTDVAQSADFPATYDPSLGYCSRGFGFGVGAPEVDGSTISFDVTGEVRWGPAGPDDPLDRSEMNEAIPFAQTGVTVAWTIIGYEGTLTDAQGTGGVDYPNGVYSDQPPLDGDALGMTLAGATASGFPAIRSFDLRVDVPENVGQGEYLRSLGVELTAADDEVGLQAEATNSSLIETASIRFEADLDAVWVDLSASDTEVTHVMFEGEHDVGYAVVAGE